MIGRGLIEAEGVSKRFENSNGGIAVASLFQPQVVVGADPGQQRDLFSTQTFDPPVVAGRQSHLGGADLFAPGSEVFAEKIALSHVLDCSQRIGALAVPGSPRTTRA